MELPNTTEGMAMMLGAQESMLSALKNRAEKAEAALGRMSIERDEALQAVVEEIENRDKARARVKELEASIPNGYQSAARFRGLLEAAEAERDEARSRSVPNWRWNDLIFKLHAALGVSSDGLDSDALVDLTVALKAENAELRERIAKAREIMTGNVSDEWRHACQVLGAGKNGGGS